MATCKALVTRVTDNKARLELEDIKVPTPADNQVLVRVATCAQNPTDYQALINNAFGEGAVLGCDFTGTVEAIGNKVTRVKKGDNIAGLIWGGEQPGIGAYSEYTLADEKICFPTPSNFSPEDLSTIPLAAGTAWLALFSSTLLAIPRSSSSKATPVLIWGGSSSVGQYAIQMAHKYNIPVIAVCSPKHFELCKSFGATECFDYHDDKIAENIRAVAPDLAHVFDCIGAGESSTLASQCVRKEGGTLCTVRPGKALTENVEKRVKVTDVLVWTVFLKDHAYKEFSWPASKEDHELGAELYEKIPGWLKDGTLKPNKSKLIEGGLEAVKEGFKMHSEGKISGFKLVYKP